MDSNQPITFKEETNNIQKGKRKLKTLDDTDLIEKIQTEKSESLKQKLLQLNHFNNAHIKQSDTQYSADSQSIRKKYEEKYLEIFDQVRAILSSTASIPEIKEEEYKDYSISNKTSDAIKAIDDFWPKCIENSKFFTINEKDKLILNNLIDIKLIQLDGLSFSLEFVFKDNDYLVNNSLKKTYCFELNKYALESSTSTEPEWKDASKDPTKKTKVKKVKKGKSKATHTITQNVESFFNLFMKDKTDEDEEETEAKFIKEDFIPNALEYYLNIIDIHDYEDEDPGNDEEENGKKGKDKHHSHKH